MSSDLERTLKIDPREVARRVGRFERTCREAGVKLTHQRREVFREVAGTGDHPDAEAVFRGVRRRIPSISLDTVYRALRLLADLGAISTLGTPRNRARFDANLDRHHHFVCRRCGLTRDFTSAELDGLELPDAVRDLGRVETTRVEVRGVCRRCAAAPPGERPETSEEKTKGAERDG